MSSETKIWANTFKKPKYVKIQLEKQDFLERCNATESVENIGFNLNWR